MLGTVDRECVGLDTWGVHGVVSGRQRHFLSLGSGRRLGEAGCAGQLPDGRETAALLMPQQTVLPLPCHSQWMVVKEPCEAITGVGHYYHGAKLSSIVSFCCVSYTSESLGPVAVFHFRTERFLIGKEEIINNRRLFLRRKYCLLVTCNH